MSRSKEARPARRSRTHEVLRRCKAATHASKREKRERKYPRSRVSE